MGMINSSKCKVKSLKFMEAFTLLETIVVVTIIGLVLPAIFSIIFIILQQQVKVLRLQQVKKEGDFVMSLMEYTIREKAVGIYNDSDVSDPAHAQCTAKNSSYSSDTRPLYLKDNNNNWFNYYLDTGLVSSNAAIFSEALNLTTDKVLASELQITCNRTGLFSPPTIAIRLTLCYKTSAGSCASTGRPEDTASMTYNSRVKLNSY